MADKWTEARAKKKFEQVVELAATSGPQKVTRKGKLVAVVVLSQTWKDMNSSPQSKKSSKGRKK